MNAGTAGSALFVNGVALWAPRLPGWAVARAVLRGDEPPPGTPATRPAATLLPPTERRRAPDTVVIALEVGSRACQDAGVDPKTVAGVFACTHGDLAIGDYLCTTLATSPTLVSPTKFHNSVHNAPAGYWSIGTGSFAPYTSIVASKHTFGAGFLEAATQVVCEGGPILYVAYDTEARGPLANIFRTRGLLATGLVLAAEPSTHSVARISWHLEPSGHPTATPARPENAALVEPNAMKGCLALFEAIADANHRLVIQTLSRGLALHLEVEPWPP